MALGSIAILPEIVTNPITTQRAFCQGLKEILWLGWFSIRELRGGAIATPGPPNTATFATLVKLLPFATAIFRIDRRSSIDPNPRSFHRSCFAGGAAELVSVNCARRPFRHNWLKSFHI